MPTKEQMRKNVEVVLTYPLLYVNEETGEPERLKFNFRRQRAGEGEETKGESLLSGAPDAVDRFAALLTTEPEGFPDFPRDQRPLADRAREYFSDPEAHNFVKHAMEGYWRSVLPAELFR